MKKQGHVLNIPKKMPKPRQSHFGTYGTRQPVTGSDHKRNLHDKVDNFIREDGFRRRSVKGIVVQPHRPIIKKKLSSLEVSSKFNKLKIFSLLIFSLLVILFFASNL